MTLLAAVELVISTAGRSLLRAACGVFVLVGHVEIVNRECGVSSDCIYVTAVVTYSGGWNIENTPLRVQR